MKLPALIVITDVARYGPERTFERLLPLLAAAVSGSVMVQLRDRALSASERLALARELRKVTRSHGQLLCINDRLDLALVVGSDAVHLGEHSVTPVEARALVGSRFLITRACHDPDHLTRVSGAHACLLSPVFSARKGNPALGFGALERARQQLLLNDAGQTLYALGGVDADAARRCVRLGVGVAVVGAVFDAVEPSELLDALGIAC